MAAWRPELTTLEQVVSFYENSDLVQYKVFAGNKPDINSLRWEYRGDNKNEGMNELERACLAILANPSNINSYTLQLVRSDKIIKTGEHKAAKRFDDAINIVFQLNFDNQYRQIGQPVQMAGVSSNLEILLQKSIEQNNAIMSLLTAKQQDVDDDVDDGIGDMPTNPFMKLLENPVMQNMLIEKIGSFLSPNKPQAMAGLPNENEQQITQAIEILKQYNAQLGSDLMKLANIAKSDINQFNMLLSVLRANS